MKTDTIIVGAGKFGCVIGSALQEIGGHKVLLIDARKEMAASKCSGGLINPAWVNMMSQKELDAGLELLNKLYGVDQLKLDFIGAKTKTVTAHHVMIDKVLVDKRLTKVWNEVTGFGPGRVYGKGGIYYEARNIIITAGVWSSQFVKIPGLCGKQGVSLLFPGPIPGQCLQTLGSQGFIRPWAPYKQVVAHKHNETHFWAGDGTAILDTNWSPGREREAVERVAYAVHRGPTEALIQRGIRPFVSGVTNTKPCYFKKIKPRVYVATGAGKSGMIASAWCALRLLKELKT